LSESTDYVYKVKIAFQLSFIFWVIMFILMFYATFETGPRTLGTFFLLFSVLLTAPFLPDGARSYEELGSCDECEEE
jgi:hypothetical protein